MKKKHHPLHIILFLLFISPAFACATESWKASESLRIEIQFGVKKGRIELQKRAASKKSRDLDLYSYFIISNSRELYGDGQEATNRLSQELMSIHACRRTFGFISNYAKEKIIDNMFVNNSSEYRKQISCLKREKYDYKMKGFDYSAAFSKCEVVRVMPKCFADN